MISRRGLVDEVRERLGGQDRLVTLTGPGGIGKTWLARRAAADLGRGFAAGAGVVDVSEVTDAALLTPTVARGLGVRAASARLDVSALARVVADRHVLLVLDGCDTLLAPCAHLVTGLLTRCPRLVVLTTSRQPLRVTGEHVLAVPPLSVPERGQALDPLTVGDHEAVALFLERAAASLPSFGLTPENTGVVAGVCGALEGNPLAIELAAARVNVLAPHAILERLAQPYRLLTKGAPMAPERHGSLRSSVDASYGLCSDEEKCLWARLSVFPASFDLDAVEGVCSGDGLDETDMLDLVDSLLERSVLAREDSDATQVRYRLPESLRVYGAERLGLEGRQYWRRRHLDWCDAVVRTGVEEGLGLRQVAWFTLFSREHANFRAALDLATSDPTAAPYGLRIAVGLEPFWLISGRVGEGRHWLGRALGHGTGTPVERIRALATAAWFASLQGDPAEAERLLVEARTLRGCAGAVGGAAVARVEGAIAAGRGDHDDAEPSFREVVLAAELTGSPGTEAEAWLLLGLNHGFSGRSDDAEEAVRRCLVLAEQAGEPLLQSYALGWLGLAAVRRGDLVSAGARVRDALHRHADVGEPFGTALLYEVLAWAAGDGGDGVRAATLTGAANRLWRTLGLAPDAVRHLVEGREERLAVVRKALGVRAFQQHWNRGESMPEEAATRYAVENVLPWQRRADPSAPLTERELEVATLIGRGMANREIAAALTISVRTAQGHVESILRKLGFGSRSQVAVWVAERGAQRPA